MGKDIYIVDDNTDHHFLLYQILKQLAVPCSVRFFQDGTSLHHHLQSLTRLPALIILDLNMPGINGLQLLKLLKQQSQDHRSRINLIPVVMMSSDVRPDKITQCYQAGANGFITKPLDFEHMKSTLNAICEFWLMANRIPYPQE
jgi:CheY-like chemotaxis protein